MSFLIEHVFKIKKVGFFLTPVAFTLKLWYGGGLMKLSTKKISNFYSCI